MVDGIVLQTADYVDQVVRFRDENAGRIQHVQEIIQSFVHIFDMCKDIGRGDDLGAAVLGAYLGRHGAIEESKQGGDATLVGDVSDVAWLDAQDAVSSFVKIAEQRSVV